MNYEESMEWLNTIPISFDRDNKNYEFKLDGISTFLSYLDNPHSKLKIIQKRPVLFADLIRKLKTEPDHAVLRVVRSVTDGDRHAGAQEVYMYDFSTKLPATPHTLHEEIAGICGCSLGQMIVNNMKISQKNQVI